MILFGIDSLRSQNEELSDVYLAWCAEHLGFVDNVRFVCACT